MQEHGGFAHRSRNRKTVRHGNSGERAKCVMRRARRCIKADAAGQGLSPHGHGNRRAYNGLRRKAQSTSARDAVNRASAHFPLHLSVCGGVCVSRVGEGVDATQASVAEQALPRREVCSGASIWSFVGPVGSRGVGHRRLCSRKCSISAFVDSDHEIETGVALSIPDCFEAMAKPNSGRWKARGDSTVVRPGACPCDRRRVR